MSRLFDVFAGTARLFTITTPPLYRYPYRNSAEGLRGDMGRIGKDIAYLMEKDAADE